MDHRLGTLQVENVGKSKWTVLVTSFFNLKRYKAVLRGHENYFRTREMFVTQIPTSPCTSHNDENKITSQRTKKMITK